MGAHFARQALPKNVNLESRQCPLIEQALQQGVAFGVWGGGGARGVLG